MKVLQSWPVLTLIIDMGMPYGLENELPEMQSAWVFEKLVDALDQC